MSSPTAQCVKRDTRALLRESTLPLDLQEAILQRLAVQKRVVLDEEEFTRKIVFTLREPVLVETDHFKLCELSLTSMENAMGHIYSRNSRGAMEKIDLSVGNAVKRLRGDNPDTSDTNTADSGGIFGVYGLERDVTKKMRTFFCGRDFDLYDDGALVSMGQTFTKYHVEDLALANVQTLQCVHPNRSDAFKVWFINSNPVRGLKLRQSNEHSVSPRLARDAEFIVIQREGDTVYLPPLCYHAVVTAYNTRVTKDMQYTLMSGTFFADLRDGSIWREKLPVWFQGHQTGHRHSRSEDVCQRYAAFLTSQNNAIRRANKKRTRKDKARKASQSRWQRK